MLSERAMKGNAEDKPRLSTAEIIAKAGRFAALPVIDNRPATVMIDYDADGLPK